MSKEDGLNRFLRQTFLFEHREGPCFHLTLRHVVPKTQAQDVSNYPIGDSASFDEKFVEDIQRKIETDAEMDAEGNGGLQKYALYAFHSGSPDKHLNRFVFRKGDPDNLQNDFNSEPANADGMLAMQMRHNEALMRTQVSGTNNIMSMYQRQLESLAGENEMLLNERRKNFELMEEMQSRRMERHLAEQEAMHQLEMKDKVFNKLSMLAGPVLKKLTGQNILPEGKTNDPQSMMLKDLSKSIMGTPGKLEKIMASGLFSMEELTIIASLIDSTESAEGTVENTPPNGKAS